MLYFWKKCIIFKKHVFKMFFKNMLDFLTPKCSVCHTLQNLGLPSRKRTNFQPFVFCMQGLKEGTFWGSMSIVEFSDSLSMKKNNFLFFLFHFFFGSWKSILVNYWHNKKRKNTWFVCFFCCSLEKIKNNVGKKEVFYCFYESV